MLNVMAHVDGDFECRYGIVLLDYSGSTRAKFISPPNTLSVIKGETRCVEMLLNPVQLGAGEYIVSVSIHGVDDLTKLNSTHRYDLLARCFELSVQVPDTLAPAGADFFHTSEWGFGEASEPRSLKFEDSTLTPLDE